MGYTVFSVTALLCLALKGNPLFALLIAASYGVYMGTVETVQRALLLGYAPSDLRATAYGIYYMVIGLSFLAANTMVGSLWDYFGIGAAFTYSLTTSVAAIVAMIAFIELLKEK